MVFTVDRMFMAVDRTSPFAVETQKLTHFYGNSEIQKVWGTSYPRPWTSYPQLFPDMVLIYTISGHRLPYVVETVDRTSPAAVDRMFPSNVF